MALTSPLRYDSSGDVIRRLQNTFVLYQGRPVYCWQIDNLYVGVVEFDKPHVKGFDPDITMVHSSDTDIDLESPHLGWANIETRQAIRPAYFLRTVNRQYSQGVDIRKTNWLDATKDSETLLPGYAWNDWTQLQPIADMMVNRGYPSINEAAKAQTGRAFDVDWALTPTKSDHIRTLFSDFSPVGYYDISLQRFVFKKGSLTKTRHHSLEKIFNLPVNRNTIYVIDEANT